ncbi:HIRAN domain-containing protein [Citreimonas sp.]|uniref:HIRAN domain-containing protein n=1 Tax=Citreimonas sp. TaxID=3036715 RepID=UPI0035C8368F
MRTYVAGTNRPEVRGKVHALKPGAPLRLLREPHNDYDARAVSVWAEDDTRLGCVPRVDNQALANLMDAGLAPRAIVSGVRPDPLRPELRVEITLPLA